MTALPTNKSSYLGNPRLKGINIPVQLSSTEVDEYIKCRSDILYFIKNYVKIVHPDKGEMLFEPWDFQEETIRTIQNNRFVICKYPRQTGKTTCYIAYILHEILFNSNMSIAILANKGSTAREILWRLRFPYEFLPKWMQQGIIEWNKGNIELENGSKVLASSTSSSSVRGGTYNMIFLDEFAFVQHTIANQFFQSVYPTISAGKTTKVVIVSTPNGMNLFYKMWMDAENKKNNYVSLSVHWSQVPGRDDAWRDETIRNTSQEQFAQEYDCEFLGSANTLISATKLRTFIFGNPIYQKDGLDIYEEPIENHNYVLTVDISEGQGLDAHAASLVDVTEVPYQLVGKYQNNHISPMLLPDVLAKIGTDYNEADILVEVNNGQEVVSILHNELEYPNVLMTTIKGRAGQVLGEGFGGVGKSQLGIKMSKQVKRLGCISLKTLVEENKPLIPDFDIISELTMFIAKKGSFAAEDGHNDDLAMTLVIFAWMVNQPYFKELTDHELRKKIFKDRMDQIYDNLTPFGIIDDAVTVEPEVDGEGTRWWPAEQDTKESIW